MDLLKFGISLRALKHDLQCVLAAAEYNAVGVDKFIAIPLARNEADLVEQTRLLDEEVIPGLASI